MKLYLLTSDGLGNYYMLAESPDDANKKLRASLREAEYGFHAQRNIEVLAKEVPGPQSAFITFDTNARIHNVTLSEKTAIELVNDWNEGEED
ncbi:hypothetical protein KKH23_07280, partial [Patescibacteria group bacterium]|nr:hypothetical protein [Patescibacteria group bacterium]